MPDAVYKEHVLLFQSKGIFARQVDDLVDPQGLLNEDNVEELAEGAYAQTLGFNYRQRTRGPSASRSTRYQGPSKPFFKLGQLAGVYARIRSDERRRFVETEQSPTVGAYSLRFQRHSVAVHARALLSWTNTDWTSSN